MTIGIDATLLREGRVTGVERYTINLIKNILKEDSFNQYKIFFKEKVYSELIPFLDKCEFHICPVNNRVYCDQIWLPRKINSGNFDLVHYPAFPSSPFSKVNSVLTIHDATFWKYPETMSAGGKYYYKPLFPQAIKKAKKIITVSHSSKKDLIKYLNIPATNISVIYEALDDSFLSKKSKPLNYLLPDKYILSVGTIEPRKNIITLIDAFQQLKMEYNVPHELVIVGRKGWIRNLNIPEKIKSQIHFTGFVSDDELAGIYESADIFVFPSLYEGFGFPILEAMAMNIPIVASNTSSLPEIGKNACLYAQPSSAESFKENIIKIIKNPQLREELVNRGRSRFKDFSWKKTACQTIEIYNSL